FPVGSATVRAEFVNHRGPTLGYAIAEPGGATFCYLPDHEPALIGPLDELDAPWISGYALAHGADLLLHDCQYTDAEYPSHFGWGHSSLTDVLTFARRTGAKHTLLAHHDPDHSDDDLDAMLGVARRTWAELGGESGAIDLAAEHAEREVVGGQVVVELVPQRLGLERRLGEVERLEVDDLVGRELLALVGEHLVGDVDAPERERHAERRAPVEHRLDVGHRLLLGL